MTTTPKAPKYIRVSGVTYKLAENEVALFGYQKPEINSEADALALIQSQIDQFDAIFDAEAAVLAKELGPKEQYDIFAALESAISYAMYFMENYVKPEKSIANRLSLVNFALKEIQNYRMEVWRKESIAQKATDNNLYPIVINVVYVLSQLKDILADAAI